MREPIWKRGTMHSTQPEAGMPPEEDDEATGTPQGGASQGGGGGAPRTSDLQDEGERVDVPPGNANPAKGID